jgi:hypothetical protein
VDSFGNPGIGLTGPAPEFPGRCTKVDARANESISWPGVLDVAGAPLLQLERNLFARALSRANPLLFAERALVRWTRALLCAQFVTTSKEVGDASVRFVLTVSFWVFAWIVILFVGLMPLPPVAELIIVVRCIAHAAWFVHQRLSAIATRRARVQAGDEELHRRRSRLLPSGDLSHPLAPAEPVEPTHHSESAQ